MSDFTMKDESTGIGSIPNETPTGLAADTNTESTLSEAFESRESDPLYDSSTGTDRPESDVLMSGTDEEPTTGNLPAPIHSNGTTGADSNGLHLSDIKQSAADAAAQAKTQAGQMFGQAKDVAGQALSQAKDQVRNTLGQQKDRAADGLTGLTQSVHNVGDTFRTNNLPQVADATEALAGHVDRIAGYLKSSEIDDLARDAERFARENPAVVLAGALVVGILIGRFFRSSGRSATPETSNSNGITVLPSSSNGRNRFETASNRQDRFDDNSIESGRKPLTANGYVPGGVLGGAPS